MTWPVEEVKNWIDVQDALLRDPWFVSGMMDGISALILWASMANCTCQWCFAQRLAEWLCRGDGGGR